MCTRSKEGIHKPKQPYIGEAKKKCNWDIRQMDINNTLLNGQIKEAIYMCHPEGVMIQLARPQHNCKLAKAIYGLKFKTDPKSMVPQAERSFAWIGDFTG